jgi:hypothetical protein
MSEGTRSELKILPRKNLIQRLFCKHFYALMKEELYECGMSKVFVYQCFYCGKTKYKFI